MKQRRTPTPPGRATVDGGLRLRMRAEERRIAEQHERLDALCREVYSELDKDGAGAAINDYLLFLTALDAHMKIEEEIYFPAVHGLSPDVGAALSRLVAEHEAIRAEAEVVKAALKAACRRGVDPAAARWALRSLARQVAAHEEEEEDVLARVTEGPVARWGHSPLEA